VTVGILALANEVVAGIAQAVATVIAVVVGYGLSVLSDRKTRQSVLDSQDRDRRLEALVDIVDNMMQLREAVAAAANALSPVRDPSNASATAKASHDAALSTAQRSVQPIIADASQRARVVTRLGLAMRVLGSDPALQALTTAAGEQCTAAVAIMAQAAGDPVNSIAVLTEAGQQLDASIEKLLDAGATTT